MKLYLMRHGESEASGFDDERALSPKGMNDVNKLANFLAPLKLQVSYLFQSPKFRAQQTASILSSAFFVSKGTETKSELEPIAPVETVLEEILALGEDVLLVGHMPFLGKLVSKLVIGNEHNDIVALSPGSMVCLEHLVEDQWVIRWMLSSELFGDR